MKRLGLILAGALWCVPATALDTQLHGFIAQGALLSEGNELFGESTEGSIEYSEAGLNAGVDLGYGVRASGQMLTRRAGENDDGKPRLDFGFVDYRPLRGVSGNLGIRAGKVKNFWGLYNAERDVVFARPGILLPDSLYSDISGQRAILFSSEGVQAYGDVAWGEQLLSLVVTGARERRLSDLEKRKLIDLGGVPFELDLRDYWQGRLMDEIDGGRWRLAVSALHATFDLDAPSIAVTGDLRVEQLAASAQFNGAALSVTGELIHNRGVNDIYAGGSLAQHSKPRFTGGYLQGQYRLGSAWSLLARFDAMVQKVDGQDCEERSPPQDRHECVSYDTTVGGNWQPDPQWGVWAEWHFIDGVFNRISTLDNPGGPPNDPHWNVFLLMAAYRF
jgi:hypothetical protein